jgi:hypothetical protein
MACAVMSLLCCMLSRLVFFCYEADCGVVVVFCCGGVRVLVAVVQFFGQLGLAV